MMADSERVRAFLDDNRIPYEYEEKPSSVVFRLRWRHVLRALVVAIQQKAIGR